MVEAEDLRAVGCWRASEGAGMEGGSSRDGGDWRGIGVASGRVELDESRRVEYSADDM